jgi:hypothetical protein
LNQNFLQLNSNVSTMSAIAPFKYSQIFYFN